MIKDNALAWYVARASVDEIDKLNILHASMLAMQRAVSGLKIKPNYVLVDDNRCPNFSIQTQSVVKVIY